jgi:hypothetical protein
MQPSQDFIDTLGHLINDISSSNSLYDSNKLNRILSNIERRLDFFLELEQLAPYYPIFLNVFYSITTAPAFSAFMEQRLKEINISSSSSVVFWTRFISQYFSQNVAVLDVMRHIRSIMTYQTSVLVQAMIDGEQEKISLLLYWGVSPNRMLQMPDEGVISCLELAITLGAQEILNKHITENRAVESLLAWHRLALGQGISTLQERTQYASPYHYAVMTGNISAISLLLRSGMNYLACDTDGQTFFDMLVDCPRMPQYYREVFNLLTDFNNPPKLLMLFSLFMHVDGHDTSKLAALTP